MDDINNGGHLGHDVLTVKPLDDYMLLLTFDNGKQRIFDVKPSFIHDVYNLLKDKDYFKLVKVDYGTVVWPDNIDFCPDILYTRSIPVTDGAAASSGLSAVAENQQEYTK